MIWFGIIKQLMMCFNKNNKFFFQNANRLFELRIKIYRNLIFEGKNLKPEEFIAERVKLKNKELNKKKKQIISWVKTISFIIKNQ